MIRQTRRYLTGALSGAALVGIAVAAFVLLVTIGAVRDWPLVGFGGAEPERGPAISQNSLVPGTGSVQRRSAVPAATAGDGATAGASSGPSARGGGGGGGAGGAGPAPAPVPAPVEPAPEAPGDGAPGGDGGPGGGAGNGSPDRGGSAANPSPSGARSGSGAGSTDATGGGQGGGSGESGSGGSDGSGSEPTPSQTIADSVNETVSGVDDLTGGALEETEVTEVTGETVDEVAGPESTVGETVDETVEGVRKTVDGLLGGDR